LTRHVIAVSQMLTSALLIHLTGGRIETHFHVFGSLAFLAFYRDWRVLVSASLVVALDHYVREAYWPQSVYGVLTTDSWRWLEHAGWVVFEDVILIYALSRSRAEMWEIAQHRAQMEATHERVEEEKVMAEAANRAKNEFLSRMSHELRTPLNAILGFGQLLEMNPLTDDQSECVDQINRGGKHLLGLINEVLDIARIEAGRMELSPEPVRVADAFREVLDLVRPLGAPRGIRFHTDLAGAGGLHVLADNQKLKQVLLNLLSNAVKYNRDRGEVRLSCEEAAPGRLRLGVSDTGPGIAPENMARLFVPFDRLGAEQTGVEGSGLGLALCKSLVELMGGTLTVTSAVGLGSRFQVELARAEAPHEPLAAGDGDAPVPEAGGPAARTVLYIEDNLDNLRLVQRILARRPGVNLLTAMQGSLGTDLARQHRPDLILLDVHLPDLTGDQVLRRLQADPETRPIPVVVISADATPRQIERLRAAGARDYLTKPIDVPRFLGVVGAVLQGGTAE
jgi:signal transduction histidine kinase/CheY-like chemotaxis protein